MSLFPDYCELQLILKAPQFLETFHLPLGDSRGRSWTQQPSLLSSLVIEASLGCSWFPHRAVGLTLSFKRAAQPPPETHQTQGCTDAKSTRSSLKQSTGHGHRVPSSTGEDRRGGRCGKPVMGLTASFVLGVSACCTASHLHTDLSKPVHEKINSRWLGPLHQHWLALGPEVRKNTAITGEENLIG